MTTNTQELVKRLEGGEVGGAINAEVLRIFKPDCIITEYVKGDDYLTVFHAEPLVESKQELPGFSTSLDAAVALVERVRPRWSWKVSAATHFDRRMSHAEIWTGSTIDHSSVCPTPAAALLAALLKARGE